MSRRYSVETTTGRTLLVYAPDVVAAIETAEKAGFAVQHTMTRYAGTWDSATCSHLEDPTVVTVEGDVHAKPQKRVAL